MTTTKPAVGYIRMSTDKQEDSPAQQKAEITYLAQPEGYRIIRWYEDHGAELNAFLLGPGFGKVRIDARREAIPDLGDAIQFVDVILQQSPTTLSALDRSRSM